MIGANIRKFEQGGDLQKLAKWKWFACEFGQELSRSQFLSIVNIASESISWLRE
jgi:hypothetical protein